MALFRFRHFLIIKCLQKIDNRVLQSFQIIKKCLLHYDKKSRILAHPRRFPKDSSVLCPRRKRTRPLAQILLNFWMQRMILFCQSNISLLGTYLFSIKRCHKKYHHVTFLLTHYNLFLRLVMPRYFATGGLWLKNQSPVQKMLTTLLADGSVKYATVTETIPATALPRETKCLATNKFVHLHQNFSLQPANHVTSFWRHIELDKLLRWHQMVCVWKKWKRAKPQEGKNQPQKISCSCCVSSLRSWSCVSIKFLKYLGKCS